ALRKYGEQKAMREPPPGCCQGPSKDDTGYGTGCALESAVAPGGVGTESVVETWQGGMTLSARPAVGLLQCLQQIPDPRGRKGRRHDFVAMLATVVAAMFCGRQSFEAIAEWIHAFEAPFWHRLGYQRRPP